MGAVVVCMLWWCFGIWGARVKWIKW